MADIPDLIRQARLAQQRARAAYSGYPVGVAVLGTSGNVYPGCNIESSAYPTTMCAERVAIFGAIASGEGGFQALVVIAENGSTPCGACRRVIHEQCGEISIYLVGNDDQPPKMYATLELLPYPFDRHGP